MDYKKRIFLLFAGTLMAVLSCKIMAQQNSDLPAESDSLSQKTDSTNRIILQQYKLRLQEIDSIRRADSVNRVNLEMQLASLKTTDNLKKEEIQKKLDDLERRDNNRIARKKMQVDSLRSKAIGFPVKGVLNDTIFSLYTRLGSFTARERADNISARIESLYDDDFMDPDSLYISDSDAYQEIMYKEHIVMSVTETDAIWNDTTIEELSKDYLLRIQQSIKNARIENSLPRLLTRIGLVILTIIILSLMIFGVNKLFKFLTRYAHDNKKRWFKNLKYKDYTFLSTEQEIQFISNFFNFIRWITIIVLLFLVIPVIFSIFPFTKGWADVLFGMLWSPARKILLSIWKYLPNIFAILVIYLVIKYIIRLVRYIFREIESEKLKINGFHSDWASPTFTIIRFLLYAFAFILIFPYLPGSDSPIFKGVSVFLGLLVSLGSSSAIANMVAGLVITYMRPFVIGDRIKINDISGDVIEKTLLVTRLRTVMNEEITIPNSSILTGNTINYSSFSKEEGLIIHTVITFGYEIPWQQVNEMLIEAALRCKEVLRKPAPFVLQVSLDDFYVSYQINAYVSDAKNQVVVYSQLHGHIQDVCNEHGVELMSPHYRAHRDGNQSTIQPDFLPKNYETPAIRVEWKNKKN